MTHLEVDEEDEDEIDLGTPDEAEEEVPLEEKYAEQMRQIFPQKIELPISTLVEMVAARIDLNPDFQRRDVWDQNKQSKFIESLIMNVPVPPVFMGEDRYSKYVVLDGRQRLTAIVKFLKNEYELKGLHVWSELNGKRYSQLEEVGLDVTLMRRFLPAVLLLKESSAEIKYDVFERLNTGGLNLKPMEIRNAVYRGPFTDLLHKCASENDFRKLWGIPESDKERKKNSTYSRMTDLELVLRFFALGEAQSHKRKKRAAFKIYLGNFMQGKNEKLLQNPKLVDSEFNRFIKAVSNCLHFLGADAFRPLGKKDRSAPFADALMYGLAELDEDKAKVEKNRKSIREAVERLQSDNEEFKTAMASGTNGKAKIEIRLGEARKAIESTELVHN